MSDDKKKPEKRAQTAEEIEIINKSIIEQLKAQTGSSKILVAGAAGCSK